jgi:hypothetical protein
MRARKRCFFMRMRTCADEPCRFEKYPEDAAAANSYGVETEDPLGYLFPGFDYTR